MADDRLLDKIQTLGDLELATLLCLVAREHCLIGTLPDSVDELAEELRLIATKTFNLTSAIVSCHSHTTLDEFATGLLVSASPRAPSSPPGSNLYSSSPYHIRQHDSHAQSSSTPAGPSSASYFPSGGPAIRPGAFSTRVGTTHTIPVPTSPSIGNNTTISTGVGGAAAAAGSNSHSSSSYQQPHIANVIIAKDLDRAPRAVQIQALELLRTRRIFTRTSVQTAPKQFLFVALVGAPTGGQARVTPHLNDFFYLAHWHDPEEDGFTYLYDDENADDAASTVSSQSVVKRTPSLGGTPILRSSLMPASKSDDTPAPLFTEDDISLLAQLTSKAHLSVEVTRYQMNIVSFLRMHRAVAGGVSPQATKHFENLAKSLAPLHGLDYVTPSLIALAAKKAYLHRLKIVESAEKERSVQWGSDVAAVEILLEGIGPEDIIEDVLGMVGVPS